MTCRRLWAALIWVLAASGAALASGPGDEPGLEPNRTTSGVPAAAGGTLRQVSADVEDAVGLQAAAPAEDEVEYSDNFWLRDFEVHFFVSLPFTALYSYLAVAGLDGAVQGKFPTVFRQADMWVVTGLAVGSAAAVALGSLGRVPDQSRLLGPGTAPEGGAESAPAAPAAGAGLRIDF